jgi:hypothetical protein
MTHLCLVKVTHLTGQSDDHEKPSCDRPGEVGAGSLPANCLEAKTFSFPVDFFRNQVTLDRDLRAPSHKNEERLAGQDPHEERGLGPVFTIEGGTINIICAEGS